MFGVVAVAVQISAVLQVLLAAFLVTLVLMHSGREAGMGGLGFTPHSQGGTHVVERNLTRLTVAVAVVFTLNTMVLFQPPLDRPVRPAAARIPRPRAGGGIGRRARLRA